MKEDLIKLLAVAIIAILWHLCKHILGFETTVIVILAMIFIEMPSK